MNMDYEKRVGATLRALRQRRGLTQDQVSAQMQVLGCDITRSAVAKIEAGQRHLYIDELKALHQVLRASYDEIMA